MGNEESSHQGDYIFGLRITGIDSNSPLKGKVNLYEDFIREINHFKNMKVADRTEAIIKPGEKCRISVYNMISNSLREIECMAHDNPGFKNLESLLGIRYTAEEEECAWNKVMRVMEGMNLFL